MARGRGGGPGAAARPGRGGRERSALQAALPGYSWHHFPEQKLRGGERGASAGSAPPVTSPGPPARRRGASGARPAAPGREVMGAARPCACAGRPRERCAVQPGREEAGLRRAKPQPLPAGGDHRSPSPSPPRELPGEPVPTCCAPGVRPPGLRISSEDAGSSFPLPSRRFLFFPLPRPLRPLALAWSRSRYLSGRTIHRQGSPCRPRLRNLPAGGAPPAAAGASEPGHGSAPWAGGRPPPPSLTA